MSSERHTPGPWFVSGVRHRRGVEQYLTVVSETTDKSVVEVVYTDRTPLLHAESYADARLIAAAPELLRALQEFMEHTDLDSAPIRVREQARAAIAKAQS